MLLGVTKKLLTYLLVPMYALLILIAMYITLSTGPFTAKLSSDYLFFWHLLWLTHGEEAQTAINWAYESESVFIIKELAHPIYIEYLTDNIIRAKAGIPKEAVLNGPIDVCFEKPDKEFTHYRRTHQVPEGYTHVYTKENHTEAKYVYCWGVILLASVSACLLFFWR